MSCLPVGMLRATTASGGTCALPHTRRVRGVVVCVLSVKFTATSVSQSKNFTVPPAAVTPP